MPVWSAEVSVSSDLAASLIRDQFPQLDVQRVELLATGWDNTVFGVDERWVFRFPHRSVAVANLERELRVLPRLTALGSLPLATPSHLFVGRAGDGYPWLFAGGPMLPGREPAEVAIGERQRVALGTALGEFLGALHARPAPAELVAQLPDDPMGRADMAIRAPLARQQLTEVQELGVWEPPAGVWRVLDAAAGLDRPAATVVVHGDLHHRHLLVDDSGAATAVIDWGDVCRGDPAVDLPLYWSLLEPAGRTAFMAAYGPVNEEALLRARVLAFGLAATLAIYAHAERMPSLERESVAGLRRAAVDGER